MKTFEQIRNELPRRCRILAVSKFQPVDKIENLFERGQKAFAENYVQEAMLKQTQLTQLPIEWHFIGHLQKNKAKEVVGQFDLIHSVDSLSLAEVLNRRAEIAGLTQAVLIQLNLADEASKGGFSGAEFENKWRDLNKLNHLQIRGLMTMPPLFDEPEKTRPYFKQLRQIQESLIQSHPDFTELSMGTSSDYQVAAEEGATWVRLGTVLFGERPTR